MGWKIWGAVSSIVFVACGSGTPEVERLAPPPAGEGFQLSMTITAPPASETWKCAVYRAPITQIATVNRAVYRQTPGLHHMTLSTPTLSGKTIPYGLYDCKDLTELMGDVVMFFGSQGEAEGDLRLPEGVAATFPAGLDVVHEVHYVNATNEPVEVFSTVNAYVMPQEDVVKGIWGGQVRDEHLVIPPQATHTEWTRCVMNEDIEVLFLASHTHGRAIEFSVSLFDGENAGEAFYTNENWHDPKITQYDPPLVIRAGTGFEHRCTYRNNDDRTIEYGLEADDEMCNLAIVHTPFSRTAQCEVVASSDGVLWKKN